MRKIFTPFLLILLSFLTFTLPSTAQQNEYLKVVGNATVVVKQTGTVSEWPDLWYQIDEGNWVQVLEPCSLTVPTNSGSVPHYMRLKGNNPTGFNKSSSNFISFAITGGNPSVQGNVMSLIDPVNFATATTIPCDYCFYALFCPYPPTSFSTSFSSSLSTSTSLSKTHELVLPATTLTAYCYAYMFAGNSGLYTGPSLPATVMQPWCYAHMFDACRNNFYSSTAANSGWYFSSMHLPAQQLAEGCYAFMFNRCDVLCNNDANNYYILPAEELAPKCYMGMFGLYNAKCTTLKYVEIMATSLQDRRGDDLTNCCAYMFNNAIANATSYGRGGLTLRFYWLDWGAYNGSSQTGNGPTQSWFLGYSASYNTFLYQSGLTPVTKGASSNYANTMYCNPFPYSSTLTSNNFTYLTFDCKTNGGTWEADDDYDTDLRRVVRTGYTAKTVPAAPHKLGCTFLGWYTAPDGGTQVSEATIKTQTTAQTYYAHFMPNDVDFTVTIANGAHGHVVVTKTNADPNVEYTSTSSVHNMSELTITAVPDAGYRFKNWTGEAATIKAAEDAGNTYYLVDDITVGAEFEADECTVTILTPTEYGSLAASDGTNNYASGNTYTFNRQNDKDKVLTFTATPATHRLFTGFTGTALSNVTAAPYVYDQVVTGTYTITADTPDEVTVGATFTVPQFTVTATKTGRGNGSVVLTADGYPEQTGSGTYDIDAVVTLTATPANAMFKFVRWTDNDSDNPVRTYTVLGDASFEAEFDLDGDLWSAPATVDVYASGVTRTCASTITISNYRILYNLDPVVGDDGITYTPVDMGAGVAWADKNVGAANVTDAGSYFYWGGIIPYGQTGYTTISSSNYYTGVTDVTANTSSTATTDANQFPAAADAAKTIMGSQWRTPNIVEMNNLITSTYTTVSTTTGPYTYTNKYYPDDKIQIPLAGRYATSLAKGTANLWTSTLAYKNGASSKPWCYYNNKVYGNTSSTGNSLAYYALPVRAVYVPSFETCTLTVIVYWASTAKYYYKYICEVGQTVTIKQHPNYTKYVFGAWRENTYSGTSLSTDNSYTVTLTGDQTIAAHYVSNNSATILLTLNAVPTKGGTADGGGYYVNGTNITLTANPNENYRFVRWSDGNTSNPRSYTTTASAVTLTAEFEYTGTASSADADEEIFAYMPQTNCFKVLYDYPASLTGDDGITYSLVDMGNGVLWANKNVGAADSTKAGSYFYWGGTTPVTKVGTATTWAGAQDMLLTTSYTTYSTLSPKVAQYALPADNDAATVKMGERWRMPTYEEIYYLANPTGAAETGSATLGMTYTNTLSGEKLFIPNSGYYKTNNSSTITTNHSLFWASTMGTYSTTNSSCVAGYYYDGSATANSSTYGYIWYAMPVRGVYVPPFETCTIKVQVAGGSNQLGNGTATYYRYYICEKGQKLRLTAHPHSVGATTWTYAFTGWTDVTNGNATLSDDPTYEFIVSEDKEIMATFAATTTNFSTIQALPLPRSGGYVYGVGRYKNGVTTRLHAVPEEGYTFVRWEDNNATNPYREITVNGDASYNAVFTSAVPAAASAHKYVNVWHEATTTTTETLYDGSPLETCTLTVKTYQSNSGKATYNFVCEKGQTVTVSAFTNTANYSLLHWTNANYDIMSYDPTVELVVTGDMTYYATFHTTRVTTRTLTLVSSPLEGAIFDGAVKTTQLGVYEDGQVTKLICHPKPHYRFLYWDDDHNLTDTIRYVTVNADRTYTAVLEIDYDLASVTSADAFAQVYYGGTYQGTYLRYDLPGYDENGYRPVDVGVGVAWANKNIGAADSTKAGDYFVWGLTTPATTVNSNGSAGTYYAGVTSMTTTAGYSTVPQNTLPAEADAATQIMGERWRMPNCTEIYNLQGVIGSGSTEEGQASAGYRYTNVENTSQFIYIPAAGCMKTSGSGTVTAGTTQFWGSTASTISGASSRPSYYLSGSYSAGSTYYYAWSAMPVRAVYVPPFQTCSVKVVTNSKTYIYMCEVGQRITITAFYGAATATNQSYRVDKWVDQNNVTVCTDQTYSFIALSDVTLTVTYTSSYTTKRTLTFNVSPASSGTVNNLASFVGQYNDGAKVRIPVKAAANYRFSHWSDDVNNTDPDRVFTATANTTYTAVFEQDLSQAAEATIAQAATADTTRILYPLPVLYKNSMFYTPVDMGTGTAWCDYNVGVTAPSSPNGYYFLWGGNANKTSTYKTTTYTSGAVTNTTEGGDFPYNTTYDAALYQMGTGWRVPSKAQWDALVDNCSTGTANTFVNPGDASKTITLPQAGSYAPNTTSNYSTLSTGLAAYWSSTLAVKNGQSSQPYCYFNGNVTYGADIPISGRQGYVSYGMPVRAVYQPSFTPDTVRLRYVNEENEVTYTNTYLVQPGQPVRITAVPKEGYIFTQWSDGDTHASRSFISSGNVTLTAEFQEESSSTSIVNVVSDDVTMGTVSGGGEVERNSEVTITATPVAHYHFVKWQKDDEDIEGGASLTFTADFVSANFKAFFVIDRHTLTTTGANGTITGGGTYDYGTTGVTLTATADDHYHFVKWQKNGEDIPGEASLTVDVTADATYNAVFAIDRHTLSVTATNGTATGSGEYDYGTVVTLGVTPDEHYHFVSWSDDGAQSHSVTVTADAEYMATCSIDRFTLTVNGSNATVTGAGEYDYNTQVTVTVSPDMGYNFVRWTDGETNPSRIVTMTENKTLAYETVYVPSYAITTVASGGVIYQTADRYDMQTGPTTYSYMEGTELTLQVAASFGYTFTGWSDGNSDNPRTVTVTEAKTYTAEFSEQTHIVFHQTEGTLDFPTYAKNSFAVIGETDDVTFRLYFGTTLTTGKTNYLSNLSLDASQSYIQPTVGAKRTIASATVANVTYAGETFRAAHLTAMLTDTEGRTYDVDIYTNYCINYATFQNDYTYRYYQSYLPTESSWVTGRSFQYNENNHLSGMGIPSLVHTNVLRFFYMTSSPFNECNIWLQFNPLTEGTGNIPTGVYPINSTGLPGTVYVGSIPTGSYPQFARETSTPALYTNTGSWVFHGFENEYGAPVYNNWTLRGGYVEVVNVDEQYYVHVHAYTDGYKTLGEQDNTVIDFTAGAVSATTAISLSAQTAGGEALTDAVTATLAGASNWTDVEIGQGSHTFFSGNTLNLTAAKPGYVFSHWTVNGITVAGEDYTYAYTVGAADAAIVAVFELDTRPFYTIAAETSGRGTATLTADGYKPQTGSGYYAENTNVTMSVAAGTGATFLGWDDDNDGTVDNTQNPRTVTLTADKTYNVVFGLESSDQALNIYQAAAADTTKILYNLDAKTGLDGNTYIPVDLGYGVAWADRNVGATTAGGAGGYFRWGDPVARNSFGDNINFSSMYAGYVLTSAQDAATVNIGTAWRMPTDDDFVDLKNNTTISNNNTFTNNSDSTKYIILPGTGYKGQSSTYDSGYQYYWSSKMAQKASTKASAWVLARNGTNSYYVGTYDYADQYPMEIYYGLQIRAIYEPAYTTYTLTVNVGDKAYQYICQEGQKVTVTAVPEEGYAFSEWSEDHSSVNPRTFTVNDDMEYTATFTEAMTYHTVTVTAAPSGYGTVDVSEVTNVPHGTNITVNGSQATIYNTTVTATPAEATVQYTYTFTGWTNAPAMVNDNLAVTANFSRTTRAYVVTIAEVENGTVVVKNGDDIVESGSEVEYGTMLTVEATPADGYEFSAWTSGTPALDGNGQFELTGSITVGATFTALPEPVSMASVTLNEVAHYSGEIPNMQVTETAVMSVTDGTNTYTFDENENNNFEFPVGTELTFSLAPTDPLYTYGEWQDEDENILSTGLEWNIILTEDMDVYAWCGIDNLVWEDKAPAGYDAYYTYMMTTYAGKPIHRLSLNRTFKANAWGTICLPVVKMNIEQSAIGDMLYSLHKAYTQNNRSVVVIDFAVSPVVEPGMPYLIISPSEVKNPYFEYVMLDPSAEAQSVHDDLGGDVDFIGVLKTPVHLEPGDRGVRYLSSNKLYYPNSKGSGATITADRAYFEIRNFSPAAAPRVIVTVDGETVLEDAEELQADTSVGVSKYIENGILIIERAGQRYDGTGRRIATAPAE